MRSRVASAGARRHSIALDTPGTPVPDNAGGFTLTWAALDPSPVWAEIKPATAHDLERLAAGTVVSTASHIVTMRYHSGVTTQTRVTFEGRTFSVVGVMNPEERNVETICLCVEIVG